MDDRGNVGKPNSAVLLPNLHTLVPVAFHAQLAVVGIGDADNQESLPAADFRVDEPLGSFAHAAAGLQRIVQEIAQDDAQVHVFNRKFRRHHDIGCQRNVTGRGLLFCVVYQNVYHTVAAGEGHLHAVGRLINLFNIRQGLVILACF